MHRPGSRLRKLAIGSAIAILLAEVAARILVACAPDEFVGMQLQFGPTYGIYAPHAELPYVLGVSGDQPVDGRYDKEFRGPDSVPTKAKGTIRIVCVGASTTYGPDVSAEEAFPAALERELAQHEPSIEVFNAGVPGWVTREHLTNLRRRLLRHDPDVLVLHAGRNEAFPQLFENYEENDLHYRDPEFDFSQTHLTHKSLFRLSHLFMLLCSYRGDRLGWSSTAVSPAYGCIRWDNRPRVPEVVRNANDEERSSNYRSNLAGILDLCRSRNVYLVLTTMPVVAERLTSRNLPRHERVAEAFGVRVRANNEILRDFAREHGLPLVELAPLASEPGLFSDDCHMGAEGHRRKAAWIAPAIRDLLANRAPSDD